jgi:hypothetical protein
MQRKRTAENILDDIWKTVVDPEDFRLGKNIIQSLRSLVKDHVDGVDCLDKPESIQEAFGHPDPFPLFSDLAGVLEKLCLRKGNGDISESEKETLATAYFTVQYYMNDLFELATTVHDDSKLRAFVETPCGAELKKVLPTPQESLNRARNNRAYCMNVADDALKVQNLIVELCDFYQIPTRRNPPQRRR